MILLLLLLHLEEVLVVEILLLLGHLELGKVVCDFLMGIFCWNSFSMKQKKAKVEQDEW